MSASARGFAGGSHGELGRGTSPGTSNFYYAGSGGAHGGAGGSSGTYGGAAVGATTLYGDKLAPVTRGSGGGGGGSWNSGEPHGGIGGGVLKVTASEDVTIEGDVTATGEDSPAGGGGGAGGSIWIQADQVIGSGLVSASGGHGGPDRMYGGSAGGGGGGGRIAVTSTLGTVGSVTITAPSGAVFTQGGPTSGNSGTICINGAGPSC